MEPFLGQLMCVGFNFAPIGWARCEGQLLPISSYSALFSLLGTTYGGDGRTTFALPDLRGRTPIGVGNGPGLDNISWGERGGTNRTTLLTQNIPAHNHSLNVSSADATIGAATAGATIATPGMGSGRSFAPGLGFNTSTPNTNLHNASISNAGGSIPFNNMQPFIGMYWIIALQGLYPSRS